MSRICVNNLTFSYDGSYDYIFKNASFTIDTDWKLGFTGRNGRGKTTFLQLLCGKYEYAGTITASTQFTYFPYSVEHPEFETIDVLRAISPEFEDWQLARELHLLNMDENLLMRPFYTLSQGEQTRILLAALFLKEDQYLLIDEPTNHLDAAARETLGDYLHTKRGFLLVSHDRAFLDRVVDHMLCINKTNIEVQKGNFSSWWLNKERADHAEQSRNDILRRDIRHLEAAAQRTVHWSNQVEKTKKGTTNSGLRPDTGYIGHKAAKMMKRSKSIEARQQSAIAEKSKLLGNIETVEDLKLHPLSYGARRLVSFQNAVFFYGDRRVCAPLNFELLQGERIALCGGNGSGKSTILKRICGEDITYTGMITIGSQLKISYVSQNTGTLRGNLSDYAQVHCIDESLLKAILRKLDFSRVQFEKDLSAFSEGQKKKVLIAKSLCESAHLYVWDEPLNYIDVFSRMQIEKLLIRFAPTLLFVEHDRTFCKHIATKQIVLSE